MHYFVFIDFTTTNRCIIAVASDVYPLVKYIQMTQLENHVFTMPVKICEIE